MVKLTRSLLFGLLALAFARLPAARATELTLAFRAVHEGVALAFDTPQTLLPVGASQLSVTRGAALVSSVALVHPDGSLAQLEGQFGALNLAAGRDRFTLRGVPPGRYQGLQFLVGLRPATNHGDPAQYPPDHPLNPLVNLLHWDRQGGLHLPRARGPLPPRRRQPRRLEQHLLAIVSADSRFDRALRGEVELTELEKEGFALFATENDPARGQRGADCFHCHGGALFTDHQPKHNGLDLVSKDPGRARVTGSAADAGKFKTPSLRNVALTAPYMHDGRFQTLEQVIAHYDHGVARAANLDPNLAKHPTAGLGLTSAEKSALLAFLHTLTDEAITRLAAADDE